MTIAAWGQLALFSGLVLLTTKPLGLYMYRVFEGDRRPLPRFFGPLERFLFRLSGVDPSAEQSWARYAGSVLVFSVFGVLVTYAIQRLQHVLPFNPQELGGGRAGARRSTPRPASRPTPTGRPTRARSTMSYLTQMAGLAWHNFTSAAAGIAIAMALARGLTRRRRRSATARSATSGSTSSAATVYVLLPLSLVFALVLVSPGRDPEPLRLPGGHDPRGRQAGHRAWDRWPRRRRSSSSAPTAAASSTPTAPHPFENPTPLTNFFSMLLIFAIPAGLTYTFGRMARDQRQGWALFARHGVPLPRRGDRVAYWAEAGGEPDARGLAWRRPRRSGTWRARRSASASPTRRSSPR